MLKRIKALLSERYVLITREEWEQVLNDLIAVAKIGKITIETIEKLPSAAEFNRIRSLAESANDICVGLIPDSGIRAQSFDGAPVISGFSRCAPVDISKG